MITVSCSFRKLEGRPKSSATAGVDDWVDGFLLLNLTWVVGGWERQECGRRCWAEPRCRSAHVYRSQCELFDADVKLTHTTASIGTTLRDIRCPTLLKVSRSLLYLSNSTKGMSVTGLHLRDLRGYLTLAFRL